MRLAWPLALLWCAACDDRAARPGATGTAREPAVPSASTAQSSAPPSPVADAAPRSDGSAAAAASSADPVDATPIEPSATQAQLLALIARPPADDEARAKREAFLQKAIGPGSFGRMNQGNPEIAHHVISKAQCQAGLRGIELQTPAQRKLCDGHELMVPIFAGGDPEQAKACIDVFEFPNRPCELPFVWAGPTQARQVCKSLGKRLCTQDEWMEACRADPDGGPSSAYAYGSKLDLSACNTNRPARDYHSDRCDPTTVKTTWKTCGTHSAPAGAFPRCRSRLGVFDLHGNVAEAMTRWDPAEETTYSQLKGSAFFYVDVQRPDGAPSEKNNYPDHCAHDPRWHVQPMSRAWHVNYHLGFRCCLSRGKR